MVDFRKNVPDALPYNREQYIDRVGWYGISFQQDTPQRETDIAGYIRVYDPFFKRIISQLHNGASWIVTHDDHDMKWLPGEADNLPALRALFRQHNVTGKFKGALVFDTDGILQCATDIISYPWMAARKDGLLYKDLAITNGLSGFVIKISGHLNIDLLSTDKNYLKEVVTANTSPGFILKPYNGTSL